MDGLRGLGDLGLGIGLPSGSRSTLYMITKERNNENEVSSERRNSNNAEGATDQIL